MAKNSVYFYGIDVQSCYPFSTMEAFVKDDFPLVGCNKLCFWASMDDGKSTLFCWTSRDLFSSQKKINTNIFFSSPAVPSDVLSQNPSQLCSLLLWSSEEF